MQCAPFLFATLLVAVLPPELHTRKLPTGLKGCSRNDPDLNACMLQSANDAVSFMSKGIPSYGMLPMDPMHIEEIAIDDKGTQKQVALNLVMKNVDLLGLKNVKVNSITFSPESGPAAWQCSTPYLSLIGKYEASGRVLILPIAGNGDLNITMENVQYTYKFDVDKMPKGSKISLKPKNHNLEFNTTRVYLRLDNLFNGQAELSDRMNDFLNENWQELTKELGPPIAEALSAATNHRMEALMRLVPFEDIFPIN